MPSVTGYMAARRHRSKARWHFVESEVVDRVVTYCGRTMLAEDADGRFLDRSLDTNGVNGESLLCTVCGESSLF